MKISIPTEGNDVSAHFGRCPEFTIAEIKDNFVVSKNKLSNPGHLPGAIPQFLKENGVECLICNGIGKRAIDLFSDYNITVLQGVFGRIDDVIGQYVRGTLIEGSSQCSPGEGKGYGIDKSVCEHQ